MTEKLALFPLSTVLFPGSRLSLHIFEARYRLMIQTCLDQGTPFGVALIREGNEVGDQSVTHASIGTTAQIVEHVKLEDGRYYIAGVGRQRFRVQYPVQRQPYLIVAVELLPEEPAGQVAVAAERLRELYRRYWDAMQQLTGSRDGAEELDSDDVLMSYQLASLLQVPNAHKQRWLEGDALTRIRQIGGALRQELALISRPSRGGVSSSSFDSWN